MDRFRVEVKKREGTGKQEVKKIRDQGYIPAVIYGRGINTPVSISSEGFKVLKDMRFSESTVIDLNISGQEESEVIPVLIKDVQIHPLTDKVIHLDLLKVSLKEKIKVHIPIVLKGEAKGKEEGAVLEQVLREIEVEGLPLEIPEKLELDVSALEIGHSIHAKEIHFSGNIKVITEPEATIVALVVKKEEEAEEDELAGEEVSAEPEVLKEKKEEGQKEEEQPEEKPEGAE